MRTSLRLTRLVLAAAISCALMISTPLSIFDVSPAAAQVTDLEDEVDEAPGLGVITGTPDPGPAPEDPGDRGGFAQLGVAIVLLSGIAFIGSRVIQGARARG